MIAIIITLLITVPIAILWTNGIDKIPKDYKDEDFLNN
jgi:hypothetical protein